MTPEERERKRERERERKREYMRQVRANWTPEQRERERERERGPEQRERRRKSLRLRTQGSCGTAETAYTSGRCAICLAPPPSAFEKAHALDHDHRTGAVRGLLCRRCNTGIGNFRDDQRLLASAILYRRDPPEARRARGEPFDPTMGGLLPAPEP